MKKRIRRRSRNNDRDTMRPEYDFSSAVRGATATRFAEGSNTVVVDPALLDVFPNGQRVNQVLRALAPVLREQRRAAPKRRSA